MNATVVDAGDGYGIGGGHCATGVAVEEAVGVAVGEAIGEPLARGVGLDDGLAVALGVGFADALDVADGVGEVLALVAADGVAVGVAATPVAVGEGYDAGTFGPPPLQPINAAMRARPIIGKAP